MADRLVINTGPLIAFARMDALDLIGQLQGRRVAVALGLTVVGSLGLVARAKALGLVPAILPLIERAMEGGIHYHPGLVSRVLSEMGE